MQSRRAYPSDVSDEEWALVAPYLTLLPKTSSQREHSLREVFNGLRYVVRCGVAWRAMPHDLPPWHAVYDQAQRWLKAGCFENLVHDLRAVLRMASGRAEEPSAVVLDSRTLRSTPESGACAAWDGHKRTRGSKLHAAVDTLGQVLALHVTPANADDRAAVATLADAVQEATVCVLLHPTAAVRLAAIASDRSRPLKHTQRVRIVLLSAERLSVQDVAWRVGVSRPAVWRWQRRYAEAGVEGLLRDKTRPPGTPPHSTETVAEVLALTCSEPPGEITHWTGRAVARAVGISLRAVQRIWNAHRLQPHRLRTFKRSRDPAFAAKVEDVVGHNKRPARPRGGAVHR